MKFTVSLTSLTIGFILSLLTTVVVQAAPQPSIAYSQRHMIQTVTADGSGHRSLVPANATSLRWSPNGKWLAFINTTSNTLEMVDARGSNRQLVTMRGFCAAAAPAWSPNSSSIAFSCSRAVHAQKQQALLRFTLQTKKTDPIRPWTKHETYRSPSWSPDGNKVAYEAMTTNSTRLIITDLGKHHTKPLAKLSDITTVRDISWSPSGNKILYNDSENELYTIWTDGSHRSTISDGDSYEGSWSPDGTRIVFIEDRHDKTLSISELDGSITYLSLDTIPTGAIGTPRWSSDTSNIAFTVDGVDGGLFAINTQARLISKLAAGPVDSFGWQPQKP